MKKKQPIPNRYIVVLNDDVVSNDAPLEVRRARITAIANSHAQTHRGKVDYIYETALKGYAIELPDEAAAIAISNLPQVKWVEEDALFTFLDPAVAMPQPNESRCRWKSIPVSLLDVGGPKLSEPRRTSLLRGGISQHSRLVIRNRDEFNELWKQLISSGSYKPPLPEVDFPREMIVVAARTGTLRELEALREIAQNYQEKTTTQETKAPTPEQKPAINLQDYVGRYQVDPSMVENFILDVFVEKDQLWIKPSHSPKSQLAAKSADSFVITAVNGPITFNRDAKGLVQSLTIVPSPTSGTKPLIAKKLTLPSPSLKGNTTFRLKGHLNARVVAVAGTFNDWNQSQVLCGKEGDEWVCRIDLAPGKYTYKFIIDGDWILDPANPDAEDDERGFTNSVLVVK